MNASRRTRLWLLWAALSLIAAAVLAAGITLEDAAGSPWRMAVRGFLLPGKTTHGHHQIEMACNACHGESFTDRDAMQAKCMDCHGAELKEARDSHPRSKFTDPRNAERAALLDAAWCVTCHIEHRPGITQTGGVTLPPDYCVICHREVGKDRPSHQGLAFNTCASAGCHNFHDNRALYEDFLVKHAKSPSLKERALLPRRDFIDVLNDLSSYPSEKHPLKKLVAADADHRGHLQASEAVVQEWAASAHAGSGVNCSACHAEPGKTAWAAKPSHKACESCHAGESKGFLSGRHGMRLAQEGLSPMSPAMARLPMKSDAHDKGLGCASCHGAHGFDTRKAAVQACTACHDDAHTRAYQGSPHHALWLKETQGALPAGSGVSCATCHLPRVEHRQDDIRRVLVQHNQNDTLRPNEKMIRPVCMQCHGLEFSINALADPAGIASNFRGKPQASVASILWALQAEQRAEASRRQAQTGGAASEKKSGVQTSDK